MDAKKAVARVERLVGEMAARTAASKATLRVVSKAESTVWPRADEMVAVRGKTLVG
jgi:hypothetical protein